MFCVNPRRPGAARGVSALKALFQCSMAMLLGLTTFAQQPTTKPEQWRQDLHFLADNLTRLHPGVYRNITPEQFQNELDAIDAAIPSLPDHLVIARMVRLVAMIGDGHSSLSFTSGSAPFRRYPIDLQVFSDGLFVTGVTSTPAEGARGRANYPRAVGAKVVRIGETDILDAAVATLPFVSFENEAWAKNRLPLFLYTPEILNAAGVLPDMQYGRFTFEDVNGQQFEMEFAPIARDVTINWLRSPVPQRVPTPLYLSHSAADFYWHQFLPESHAVYFQYNRCSDMPSLPFASYLPQLLATIDSNPGAKVVVDLRHNTGGNSAIIQPFITALRARPALNQRDRLFVLIDNGTFSSGLLNALDIRRLTNAAFYGEPTGGKPNHYGEVRSFNLPNSAMTVQYSTRLFQTESGDPASLFPDVLVELSSADYFGGRDPVLEMILGN